MIIQEQPSERIQQSIDYFNNSIFKLISGVKCWVAGGCIRSYFANEKINDIDVFFRTQDDLDKAKILLKNIPGMNEFFENENCIKYELNNKKKIDLVKRFYNGITETLSNFDFTVTCAGITSEGEFFRHTDFFIDLSSKRLAINSVPFPISTLGRLQKYIKRGYTACSGTFLEIAKACSNIDFNNQTDDNIFYPDGTPRIHRMD